MKEKIIGCIAALTILFRLVGLLRETPSSYLLVFGPSQAKDLAAVYVQSPL